MGSIGVIYNSLRERIKVLCVPFRSSVEASPASESWICEHSCQLRDKHQGIPARSQQNSSPIYTASGGLSGTRDLVITQNKLMQRAWLVIFFFFFMESRHKHNHTPFTSLYRGAKGKAALCVLLIGTGIRNYTSLIGARVRPNHWRLTIPQWFCITHNIVKHLWATKAPLCYSDTRNGSS